MHELRSRMQAIELHDLLIAKASRVLGKLEKCEIRAHIGIASLPDTSLLAAHLARPILEIDEPAQTDSPKTPIK